MPPAEVFVAKMKGISRSFQWRRCTPRPYGHKNAALSPWAVIGTSPCTARSDFKIKVNKPLLSSWQKIPRGELAAGQEGRRPFRSKCDRSDPPCVYAFKAGLFNVCRLPDGWSYCLMPHEALAEVVDAACIGVRQTGSRPGCATGIEFFLFARMT